MQGKLESGNECSESTYFILVLAKRKRKKKRVINRRKV